MDTRQLIVSHLNEILTNQIFAKMKGSMICNTEDEKQVFLLAMKGLEELDKNSNDESILSALKAVLSWQDVFINSNFAADELFERQYKTKSLLGKL